MAVERMFLGWDGPMLPRAVAWLVDEAAQGTWCDLSDRVVVTPGGRAGRRLLELLAERCDAGTTLLPPRLCTLGELPELLCPPPARGAIAGEAEAMLTRLHVLRGPGRAVLETLVAVLPEEDDLAGWWALAQRWQDLTDELAAGLTEVGDVVERCAERELALPSPERWRALSELEAMYHDALADQRLVDRQRHRLSTIREARCTCDGSIVLLATADLTPLVRAMLRQVASDIAVLVHAPGSHAAGFDELGGLVTSYWAQQPVNVPESGLRIVDRTTDQPAAVAAAIADMTAPSNANGDGAGNDDAVPGPDQITVGLADPAQAGAVRRALERAGAPARSAMGQRFERTGPAVLLSTLAAFAERGRLDAFAELVRHPDLDAYLRHLLRDRDVRADWITLLDRYASDYLRSELSAEWLMHHADFEPLVRAYQAVTALLPAQPARRQPLPAWAPDIAAVLQRLYGQRTLRRFERTDHTLIGALEALAQTLRDHSRLPADAATTPRVTFTEAIRLLLAQTQPRTIPEPGGDPAIELLGLLELPLDDAPLAIINSLNEPYLPTAPPVDALLTDRMRTALGLVDAERRYARDKLLLLTSMYGRRRVALIAARRSEQGEPLAPSRLLLACDEATRVRRIRRFYDEPEDGAEVAPRVRLLAPGPRSQFLIPRPREAPHVEALAVTAFRDYLACPYRFYLRHVLRLRPLDDQHIELDAVQFGSLAHEVLQAFGEQGPTDATDPEPIGEFLRHRLDELFTQRFGESPRAALLVQRQQLIERLEHFAVQQAKLAGEGWRIAHVEQSLHREVHVDGEPFVLHGKIDRIDVHGELGYRIIDYKTGDSGKRPGQTHLGRDDAGEPCWVDLQLPLYLDLAEALGVPREAQLGYFNLPKKLEEVRLHLADWDADLLAEAFTLRDWVIRQVRAQRFWPPNEPPAYEDEFTWLCADAVPHRDQLIAVSAHGDGAGATAHNTSSASPTGNGRRS